VRALWSNLWKDIWLGLAIAVGLMSGIASILREWIAVFHPNAVDSGRLFNACLWSCFVVSCCVVIARQRIALAALQDTAAKSHQEQHEIKRLHSVFGAFMKEGESLAQELRQGMTIYGPWLEKRNDWVKRIAKNLEDINLPTEASALRHSGEKDLNVSPGTVISNKLLFDLYMAQLSGYRTELKEIMKRRIPASYD